MMSLWLVAILAFAQSFELALDEGMKRYWNGEYEATIGVLQTACAMDASVGEKLECHKYLAFSYVALGDDASAERQFMTLLEADSGYRLDDALVSPKIVERFERARQRLALTIYEQGKSAYQAENFDEALAFLERTLQLDEHNELAREYEALCRERIQITKDRTAAASPPEPEPTPPQAGASDERVYSERVYRLTSEITRPVLLERVAPQYPRLARARREEGAVVLSIVIDKSGSVTQPKVIRSAGRTLDKAAVEAVAAWRYDAATMDGVPVAVYGVIELSFELDGS